MIQEFKEYLKNQILLGNFNILNDRTISIQSIDIEFYIQENSAIICPFQQIQVELSETEELLFFQLLVGKGLNYNNEEKAILEIKRIAKKFNIDLKTI